MIRWGSYNVCLLDLICDSVTGKLSSSKIGDIFGKAVMTYIVLHQPAPMDVWLFSAYGATVTGSHVLTNLLKWKYRDAGSSATDPEK